MNTYISSHIAVFRDLGNCKESLNARQRSLDLLILEQARKLPRFEACDLLLKKIDPLYFYKPTAEEKKTLMHVARLVLYVVTRVVFCFFYNLNKLRKIRQDFLSLEQDIDTITAVLKTDQDAYTRRFQGTVKAYHIERRAAEEESSFSSRLLKNFSVDLKGLFSSWYPKDLSKETDLLEQPQEPLVLEDDKLSQAPNLESTFGLFLENKVMTDFFVNKLFPKIENFKIVNQQNSTDVHLTFSKDYQSQAKLQGVDVTFKVKKQVNLHLMDSNKTLTINSGDFTAESSGLVFNLLSMQFKGSSLQLYIKKDWVPGINYTFTLDEFRQVFEQNPFA
jgi:hypothetical protein